MSQRNPMNDRYQQEHKGQTKKSAASAKPKSRAANSVYVKTLSNKDKKKLEKERRRQEREQMYRRDDKPTVKEPTQRINAAELEDQFVGLDDFDSIMKEYNAKDKD